MLPPRILITGADGFIGRQAIKPLADMGFDVHAVNFYRTEGLPEGATWHLCNLMDPNAVKGIIVDLKPTHLLHFAWYAEHGKYWASEKNFDWVETSIRLLRTFAEMGEKTWRVVACDTVVCEVARSMGYKVINPAPAKPNQPAPKIV